jgi:hypothetical protein
MHAAQFAALFVTPPPPSGEEESLPSSPVLESPPSPVLPHQVVVTGAENVNLIHWRRFQAVMHPLGRQPQPYVNQGNANDDPDRQTCNLAGSVGHYRCSPRRPCRRPSAAEEIQNTPQCTLPVSATNGHGDDVFSWDEDYDGWF